jgi:hypothetical protein
MIPLTILLTAPASADDAEKTDFSISGVYTIWALNQRNFLLGADNVLDDADYVVQMLRLNAAFDKENYGVVTRFDAAQGWWGADNDPDVESVESADGTSTETYNPYKLFRDKDTNYDIHFDHAYGWVKVPGVPVRVQAGRQYMQAGHKLVLDQDLDGVMVAISPTESVRVELLGAKISEGYGSTKAPTGALMSDDDIYADANLGGGRVLLTLAPATVELFGLYYIDNSGDGTSTYLPQGYGYLNSRFRPNISSATALGLSVDGAAEVAGGLSWSLEGDYLMGTDDVANTDHAGGTLDINNGTLSGWNALATVDQKLDVGIPLGLGATFGMGSGDDDVTGGPGNINKIQTMGFWSLTNVWEDSVMPDVGGISPQGLGSPVSRGYRELENTTAVQGRLNFTPVSPLTLQASYTWLAATQPITGFDATGTPTTDSASDIGSEIDVDLSLNVYKGLSYKALFGYFIPGDAAGYLINGGTDSLEPAWEVKQVFAAKF